MTPHRITFTESELRATATQDNLGILALTKFLRTLPRHGFRRPVDVGKATP